MSDTELAKVIGIDTNQFEVKSFALTLGPGDMATDSAKARIEIDLTKDQLAKIGKYWADHPEMEPPYLKFKRLKQLWIANPNGPCPQTYKEKA